MITPNTETTFLEKLRLKIFPIYGKEIARFFPMAIMIFCILFNYTILRNIKDVLIATSCGAEAFSYLKLGAVAPISIFFVILFTKLSNIFSIEKIFYSITIIFIIFFILFACIIYPNKELLHTNPHSIIMLSKNFKSLRYIFFIYGVWTYSLFYVVSEMWGTIMIPLFFWQFANEITQSEEAKRFYPMFYFFGNFSLFLSGILLRYFSKFRKDFPNEIGDPWQYTLNLLMLSIIISSTIIISYWFINKFILSNTKYYKPVNKKAIIKKKHNVKDSFNIIFHSHYLGYILILVVAYGLSINLIETD